MTVHQLFLKIPSQIHFHRNDRVQPILISLNPALRISARISETGMP